MLSNVAIHDQLTSESATFKSVLSSVTLFIDCWMIGCLGKGGCVHKVLNSNSLPPPCTHATHYYHCTMSASTDIKYSSLI